MVSAASGIGLLLFHTQHNLWSFGILFYMPKIDGVLKGIPMTWQEKFNPEDLEHIKWFREFLDKEYENWLRIITRDRLTVYEGRLRMVGVAINNLRAELREEKNYELADRLRDILREAHITTEDIATNGSTIKK